MRSTPREEVASECVHSWGFRRICSNSWRGVMAYANDGRTDGRTRYQHSSIVVDVRVACSGLATCMAVLERLPEERLPPSGDVPNGEPLCSAIEGIADSPGQRRLYGACTLWMAGRRTVHTRENTAKKEALEEVLNMPTLTMPGTME